MKQMLSQVYCQQDEIDLMIREVVTWFGQVEKQRPLSLFLAGTSGVGKTFTCELLAKAMESQKFACVYFPMSEYSQESHITNLIGSSSGYEGSQETPKIFAALERSKRLVIVFDEIEKAHPTILRTLMQLFEKGVLSWSKGEGDFRQCIICFTSNAQRKELVDLKSSHRCSGRDTGDTFFQNTVRDVLTRANIAPEICGRINRFFVYNPLTPDAVFHIAMAEIQKIARSYELEMVSGDPELLAEIALSTTGSPYGARPITRRIENILGHELLQFNNLFPDVTHVAYQKSISGYEIVAINPDNGYPDMDALMHKAQTTYEDLTHARSFLNTEALYHTLSQVQCQEDNIQQLVERLEIWYSQKKKDRPLSIFLMGASGVGKTYTAELLAQVLQPYGYEYTYLAMTEYSQDSSANNLTGSARGFVGSEDKPRLFEALDRSNTSRLVILFDEIEKAHPTVFKTLMQLLDKGTLSWNRGTGDFRECIVLFTSNLQMDAMVGLKSVFQKSGLSILGTEFQEAIKQILFQTGLPRELCGRINQFLVYNPLSPEAAVQIVFQEIQKFCAKQGCQVDWISPLLLAETARLTAGSSSGARAVRDQVETLLSQPMLRFRKQFARAKVLLIDMTEAGIRILPADDVIDSSSQADMFRQALVLLSESQKHKISLDSNQ
jgi:ATP-dependent Clp protease ATP-binding subunit ClpA